MVKINFISLFSFFFSFSFRFVSMSRHSWLGIYFNRSAAVLMHTQYSWSGNKLYCSLPEYALAFATVPSPSCTFSISQHRHCHHLMCLGEQEKECQILPRLFFRNPAIVSKLLWISSSADRRFFFCDVISGLRVFKRTTSRPENRGLCNPFDTGSGPSYEFIPCVCVQREMCSFSSDNVAWSDTSYHFFTHPSSSSLWGWAAGSAGRCRQKKNTKTGE